MKAMALRNKVKEAAKERAVIRYIRADGIYTLYTPAGATMWPEYGLKENNIAHYARPADMLDMLTDIMNEPDDVREGAAIEITRDNGTTETIYGLPESVVIFEDVIAIILDTYTDRHSVLEFVGPHGDTMTIDTTYRKRDALTMAIYDALQNDFDVYITTPAMRLRQVDIRDLDKLVDY
jgi:hypothetical protein